MDVSKLKNAVKIIPRAFCRVRFSFSKPGGEQYFLTVTVIVKNEELYIREWLEYHRLAGISHVFLYDNGSTDRTMEYVRPFEADGFVTATHFPGRGMQAAAYNDALKRFGKDCRYMAFIDADEFLFAVEPGKKVPEGVGGLMEAYPKASGLAVNWAMFGSSGLEKRPESGGVLGNFIYRAKAGRPGTDCIKTIVKPGAVWRYNHPHYPEYMLGGYSVDERGQRVNGWKNPAPDPEKLRVNHYFTKSREEWILRRKLGKADQKDENNVRTMEEFVRHDNNDLLDESMRPWAALIEKASAGVFRDAGADPHMEDNLEHTADRT